MRWRLRCPVGLVTNKPRRFGAPILERLNWTFEVVVFGDDRPTRKPDPEPLNFAAGKLGCRPVDIVYVGDTSYDQRAAVAAGMHFRAVPWADKDIGQRMSGLDELHTLTTGVDI